jgi:hypothetical protein
VYWDAITSQPVEAMSEAEQRECLLESIRREPKFGAYTSRMKAFFGTNTIEDAKRFAQTAEPKMDSKVPVVEVFASEFWNLDMNWLDCVISHEKRLLYYREYWHAAIYNHNPDQGTRRPPMVEVLMALPVRIGRVVDWV